MFYINLVMNLLLSPLILAVYIFRTGTSEQAGHIVWFNPLTWKPWPGRYTGMDQGEHAFAHSFMSELLDLGY